MRAFALQVIRLVNELPPGRTADVIGRQLLRCGTSVGANYRSACRAKSPADFIAKMGIVEEEADESQYWLELLVDAGLIPRQQALGLHREAGEFVAIAVASIRTARKSQEEKKRSVSGLNGHRRSAGLDSAIRTPHSAI
jgi:four helix bundle protein